VPDNFSQPLRLESKHCAMIASGPLKSGNSPVQAI